MTYLDPLLCNGHRILPDIDPLLWNGQINIASRPSPWDWSSIPSPSRPSAKQWSLISWLHRGPLRGNGNRFLYIKIISFGMVIDSLCHIETLSMGLVIDSFAIKALCKAMVIDFLITSRPSARQWLSISLHRDSLPRNGRIHT